MRRPASSRLPEWLLVVGCGLLATVAVAAAVTGGGGTTATTTAAAPPTPPAPPAPPAPPPPPPPAPLALESAAPYSAIVTWGSDAPLRQRVRWGLDGQQPALWSAEEPAPTTEHRALLPGLEPATTYRVLRGEADEIVFTTPPAQAAPAAAVADGAITLDGQPFVPLLAIGLCPDGFDGSAAAGIDVFAAPCSGVEEASPALGGGRSFLLADPAASTTAPQVIGTYQPDEPDGLGAAPASLAPATGGSGRLTFMTLTNHFYSGADPLPSGRSVYRALIAHADVVGFDLYPLQSWCRRDRLPDVYLAQRELVELAAGRPTFQWIESGSWTCPAGATAVTPQTVTAEAWLALAGGARGLGFFPGAWEETIAEAIGAVSRTVKSLQPALAAPPVPVTVAGGDGGVVVGARAWNGALYVFAVNPGTAPATATIDLPGIGGRWLSVLGEGRTVHVQGDDFTDAFAPLGVHVYVAAPA